MKWILNIIDINLTKCINNKWIELANIESVIAIVFLDVMMLMILMACKLCNLIRRCGHRYRYRHLSVFSKKGYWPLLNPAKCLVWSGDNIRTSYKMFNFSIVCISSTYIIGIFKRICVYKLYILARWMSFMAWVYLH